MKIPPDAIPMKQWRAEEAERLGLSASAVSMRLKRGQYPDLQLHHVNSRVVYVRPSQSMSVRLHIQATLFRVLGLGSVLDIELFLTVAAHDGISSRDIYTKVGASKYKAGQRMAFLSRAGLTHSRPISGSSNRQGCLYYLTPRGQELHRHLTATPLPTPEEIKAFVQGKPSTEH